MYIINCCQTDKTISVGFFSHEYVVCLSVMYQISMTSNVWEGLRERVEGPGSAPVQGRFTPTIWHKSRLKDKVHNLGGQAAKQISPLSRAFYGDVNCN